MTMTVTVSGIESVTMTIVMTVLVMSVTMIVTMNVAVTVTVIRSILFFCFCTVGQVLLLCDLACVGRCGEVGECVCYEGWSGSDCSVAMTKPACGCGQFSDDCQSTCDMFEDCSGHGR